MYRSGEGGRTACLVTPDLSCVREGKREKYTDSYHDSPPQNQRFCLTNASWLLDMRKVAINSRSQHIFLFATIGLWNNDLGVARGIIIIVLQEVRPGAGFKTGDFVQEKLWGLQ